MGGDDVHQLIHMDWPSRLAWGLLAWPFMIYLAILLSNAADPRSVSSPLYVAVVGTAELLASTVAIVFPIWALVTWAAKGDRPESPIPPTTP